MAADRSRDPSAPDDRAWPLRGREVVVELLGRAWSEGHHVVIVGEHGRGKSRLVDEMLAADQVDAVVLSGSPTWASVPYGIYAALPGDDGALFTPGSATARLRSELDSRSGPRVLRVEDAHWLDEASAEAIATVARDEGVQLVVTMRPLASSTPFTRLWMSGAADRVELEPLGEADIAELIEDSIGVRPGADTVRRIAGAVDGNPHVLRELLREAQRSEAGTVNNGLWHLDELPIGDRLAELIGGTLDSLDHSERDAIGLVALAEPVDLDLVAAAGFAAEAERLERRGLVTLDRRGGLDTLRVSQPLLTEHIRGTVGGIQRRRLAGLLVEAVMRIGARSDRARIAAAMLALDLGAEVSDAQLLEAATTARLVFDCRSAERLAREAHQRIADVESLILLTDVLYERGIYGERDELLQRWSSTASSETATVAIRRAVGQFWGLADAEAAFDTLETASTSVHEAGIDSVAGATATLLTLAGRHDDASRVLDGRAPDAPTDAMSAWASVVSLTARGVATTDQLAVTPGLVSTLSRRSAPAAYLLESVDAARVVGLATLGAFTDALHLGGSRRTAALESGDVAALGFASLALAWVHDLAGSSGRAVPLARDAAAAFARCHLPGQQRWALGALVLAAAHMRDRDVVEDAVRRLDELSDHPARLFEATIQRGRAQALVADGRRTDARALLQTTVDVCRSAGARVDEMLCIHDLAMVAGVDDVLARRGRELAESCEGRLIRLMSRHLDARRELDATALEAVGEAFLEIGAVRFAAEASMAAVDAYAQAGDQSAARRVVAHAQELAGQVAMSLSDHIDARDIGGRAARLTPREVEIGALAATGLTSPAIAERLYVSSRTVDNHLARIYGKLHISGRSQLAAHFERSPAVA